MNGKPWIAHLSGPTMACLMKFGSLPVAKDPDKPTLQEIAATKQAVA